MSQINYYMVGGYVRDSLLGVKSHDVDFAVEAPSYEAMKQDLIDKGIKIYLESPEYFTIRGSHPEHGGVDYVLCRKDGVYKDGRHPESVEIGTIYDDLARRDFTINAIAYSPTGVIIDPFEGQKDIERKLIRCVGNPVARFNEDALRILRAIRFAIKCDFYMHMDTYKAMKLMSERVTLLPQERIRAELDKCFRQNTIRTLDYLDDLDLINSIFGGNLWLMPTNKL